MSEIDVLRALLDETNAALDAADASVAEAQEIVVERQRAAEGLRVEKVGLEHALQRRWPSLSITTTTTIPVLIDGELQPPPATPNEWAKLARTDAVARILEEADTELSPTEVSERLDAYGRTDTPRAVGAALVYLKDKDRAHTVGRGRWKAGPMPKPPLPPRLDPVMPLVRLGVDEIYFNERMNALRPAQEQEKEE